MLRLIGSVLLVAAFVSCKGEDKLDSKTAQLGRGAENEKPQKMIETPSSGEDSVIISGIVAETIDASRYTYIKVQTESGEEIWAAVPQIKLPEGQHVEIIQSLVMKDFESKTLNRVFSSVVFGVIKGQVQEEQPQ